MDIQERLEAHRERVNRALESLLENQACAAPRLAEAMHYSLFAGGKRLRPLLVYAAAECSGVPGPLGDAAACAVELVHTYSLVHDDLPAMDDDDLRRGRPTCHRAFDEATAILAGDALQALAFTCLAEGPGDPAVRMRMTACLAAAGGMSGMVAGQAIDLDAVGRQLDADELAAMHRLKTGALIGASVRLGALSGSPADTPVPDALATYGEAIGLAFQIRDDILDVEGETGALGKTRGADQEHDKPTYTSMLGIERARTEAANALERALTALEPLGERARPLAELASYMVERDR